MERSKAPISIKTGEKGKARPGSMELWTLKAARLDKPGSGPELLGHRIHTLFISLGSNVVVCKTLCLLMVVVSNHHSCAKNLSLFRISIFLDVCFNHLICCDLQYHGIEDNRDGVRRLLTGIRRRDFVPYVTVMSHTQGPMLQCHIVVLAQCQG